MSEIYPSDSDLTALSGTSDPEHEVPYVPIGQSPYYVSFYRMLYRLLDVARRAGDLRVFKDGDLTFGVRAGKLADGASTIDFAGTAAQPLTDNAVNCIYITTAGTIAVAVANFPSPLAQPHIPLAQITTSGGKYELGDIIDCRGRAIMRFCSGLGTAQLRAALPQLGITAAPQDGQVRRITVQVQDAAGNALAGRYVVRLWCSQEDFAAPGGTLALALATGTLVQQSAAGAEMLLLTSDTGTIELDATQAGAAVNYFIAAVGAKAFSSGPVEWQE